MTPQNSGEWGIGICYFHEDAKIPFYFKENNSITGYIIRLKNKHLKLEFIVDSTEFKINYNDFNWIGQTSADLLKVYGKINENYYKVFSQSSMNGVLIKIDELNEFGLEFFDYKSLILNPTKINLPEEMARNLGFANIGLNLYKSCINLRQGPSTSDTIITCIKSNDWNNMKHTHMKIIERNGFWAKIEATTYIWEDGECDCREFKKSKGWIKALDENGRPNIWYSITSY